MRETLSSGFLTKIMKQIVQLQRLARLMKVCMQLHVAGLLQFLDSKTKWR